MSLLFEIIKAHILLLIRSRISHIYVALLLLISAGILVIEAIGEIDMGTPIMLVTALLFFQFPMLVLLIGPLVTPSRRQDYMWATPLEMPRLAVSQLISIGIFLSVTLIILFAIAFSLMMAFGSLPFFLSLDLFIVCLFALLIVTLLQASFVFMLLALIPNTIIVTTIIVAVDAVLGLCLYESTETLLSLQNITLRSWHIESVAGVGVERPLLFSLLIFYTTLIPLLLFIAMFLHKLTDRRVGWQNNRSLIFLLTALTLLICGVGWINYNATVQAFIAPPPRATQIETWTVQSAHQQASIENQTISVQAELLLQNRDNRVESLIELGLNSGFEVTVAKIDGTDANVERIGEIVRLHNVDLAIEPNAKVEVLIEYFGEPILLREDYRKVQDVFSDYSPPIFQRAYISYLERDVLLWSRDSDWLAWPMTARPHIAQNEHELTIELSNASPKLVSSGEVVKQSSDSVTLHWAEKPEQLLVAAGPYLAHDFPTGEVLIGPLGTEYSLSEGQQALTLYQQLLTWLAPEESTGSFFSVEVPHAKSIMVGHKILGIPSDNNDRLGVLGGEFEVRLDLAIRVTRAWLKEQISWSPLPLTSKGELQRSASSCDSESGKCEQVNLGGDNPQAPQGRLVEDRALPTQLQAFSIATAYHLISDHTDPSLIEYQQQYWEYVADNWWQARGYGGEFKMSGSDINHRLVGFDWIRSNCEVAHYVVALVNYQDQFGIETFETWLHELRQSHPIGSEPLSEEEVWEIGEALVGDAWRGPHPACYSSNDG